METTFNKEAFTPILRSSGKKTIKAFEFESWESLRKELSVDELSSNCVFSDLSLGAWRGHWVIRELTTQLNLNISSILQPVISFESKDENYIETINQLIDNEGEGDQNFMLAYESCKNIVTALSEQKIKWVIIIAPIDKEIEWESENIQFMNLLIDGLKNSNCNVGIISTNKSNIPDGWELEFKYSNKNNASNDTYFSIPGILDTTLSRFINDPILESSLKLSNNYIVIPPNIREKLNDDIAILNDLEGYSWLKAYYELMGLSSDQNIIYFLQLEAAKRFSEGGYGIALKILENIKNREIPNLQLAFTIMQIQNIRIALMAFSDAAMENFPFEELAKEYKYSLALSKAWGLVMINCPKEAEPYFKFVQEYFLESSMSDKKEYLYLLNIYALNKLRLGDLDSAFSFEKEIENKLLKQDKKEWHIFYINAINQARLYKKIKNYTLSEEYYIKAFDVNQYLKSESDLLYTNLCFAQLEDLRENYKSSFIFWLRTCIHWLSNETPESLAPRVSQAILHKKLSNEAGQIEEISKKLRQNLNEIFIKVFDYDIKPIERSNIVFNRINLSLHSPEVAMGTMGLGLFTSRDENQAIYDGVEYLTLTKYVYNILRILLPEIDNYNSIYTDTQFGTEIPISSKELINSCIRYKVSKVIFGTKKYTFTEEEQKKLFLSSKVKLCSAISSIVSSSDKDKLIIYYKRNRKPLILKGIQKKILESLNKVFSVEELLKEHESNNVSILNILNKMEENRLITIYT